MLEREIEQALVREVRKRNGLCLKFTSPGWAGAPDRLILLPNRRLAFAEIKAPGKQPRALQLRRKAQLERMGIRVYVIDDKEQIRGILDEISTS